MAAGRLKLGIGLGRTSAAGLRNGGGAARAKACGAGLWANDGAGPLWANAGAL